MSEVNLTPLMDLTFILLITFIITFPLIEQGIPINLPVNTSTPLEPKESRTVTVDKDGVMYLDHGAVSAEELAQEMDVLMQDEPQSIVYIRADEALAYGQVVDVMKIIRKANVTRMALVTQPEE